MQIIDLPIDSLIAYENNARTHSEAQVAEIAQSITEFGFNNPILIDEEKQIIAGHGRLLAAKKLYLDTVPTITLTHLTEAKRKAYILADNKLALNASWDVDMLKAEFDALLRTDIDITLTGFTHGEIDNMLNPEPINKSITDEMYKLPKESISLRGDIWLLGENKLVCGDSDCDKIIRAYEKFSGTHATLESNGLSFDEVANGKASD